MPNNQPNDRPEVQDLLQWVDKRRLTWRVEENDVADYTLPDFIPNSEFEEYLSHLKEALRVIFEGHGSPPDVDTILTEYPRVFCILTKTGNGIHIRNYVNNDGFNDRLLPFIQKPDFFPVEAEPDPEKSIFSKFQEVQWRFCAPTLTTKRQRRFYDGTIMPFIEKEFKAEGGSSKVYRVKIHASHDKMLGTSESGPEHRNFALKTFRPLDGNKWQKYEKEAYLKFSDSPVTSDNLIAFHCSYELDGTYNFILEYADLGTLEDYYSNVSEPRTGEEIYTFWLNFLKLTEALVRIHSLGLDLMGISDTDPEQWCHQDVNPRNILVTSKPNSKSEYDRTFKLTDFGTSRFQNVRRRIYSTDAYGTRTYGAPECFRGDEQDERTKIPITPKADIWSFACVTSEAVVWAVNGKDGKHGLTAYREKRIAAHEPNFKVLDCFHDGTKVLDVVVTQHKDLRNSFRGDDSVSGALITLLNAIFCDADTLHDRPDARTLKFLTKNIMKAAHSDMDLSRRDHSVRQRSRQRNSTSQTSGLSWPAFSTRVDTGKYTESGISASPVSESSRTYPQEPFSESSKPLPTTPSRIPAEDDVPIRRPEYQTPNTSPTVRQGSNEAPRRSYSGANNRGKHSQLDRRTRGVSSSNFLERTSQPITDTPHGLVRSPESTVDPGNLHNDFALRNLQRPSMHRGDTPPQVTYMGQAFPSASRTEEFQWTQADTFALSGRNQRVQPPNIQTEHQELIPPSPQPTKTPIQNRYPKPHAERSEILSWMKGQKNKNPFSLRDRPSLPHEELRKWLRGRDHIFLIDGAKSMEAHWDHVIDTLQACAYLTKEGDDDGIDLYFTTIDSNYKPTKKTRKVVDLVKAHKPFGETNIQSSLRRILDRSKEKLKQEKPKHDSIYVLTDGLWKAGPDAESLIRDVISTLKRKNFPRKQLGIQFIRFGHDPSAIARLNRLDELGKAPELGLDIVDTEDNLGNYWKILLGAFDERFDSDDES